MSWRAAVPVAAFALFIVGGLLLWFVWLVWQYNSTAQAQETEDCANAQVVNRFTGTGNQGTDPFEATGPFQLTYDLTAAGSANLDEPSLNIYVYDQQSGQIVADASQEGEGTGGVIVDVPPGTYTLSIFAINGEYTTTVEQCGGGLPSPDPDPGSPKTPSPTPSPSPGSLMKAGGPETGPVPLMPNGSCPREFADKRTGGVVPHSTVDE